MNLKYLHMDIPVSKLKMNQGIFGEFSYFPIPYIHINSQLNGIEETSTVLHEVLELISEVNGLRLSETQIRVLETSLVSVFLQNQWLADRLRSTSLTQHNRITDFRDWPPSQALPDSPEAL